MWCKDLVRELKTKMDFCLLPEGRTKRNMDFLTYWRLMSRLVRLHRMVMGNLAAQIQRPRRGRSIHFLSYDQLIRHRRIPNVLFTIQFYTSHIPVETTFQTHL